MYMYTHADGEEILQSADFESPLDGADWQCSACVLERHGDDAHGGSYSGRVFNR